MQENNILSDPLFWLSFMVGGFFLSLTLWFGLGMDQSIFCYSVWVWKSLGLPPYVGAWDHAFPAIFLIYRLAMRIFGESVLGFRFFDFLVQLSCLPMIFYLARRLSGFSVSGLLSAVFYSIYYYSLDVSGTAQRESYIFWVLLVCIILALCLEDRILLGAAATGFLLGFAFLLKPTFGLAWPVFGVFFLVREMKKSHKIPWRELAVFSLSCAALPLIIIFLYWRAGYLDKLYQAAIWFNFEIYTKMADPALERSDFWTIYLPAAIFMEYPLFSLPALGILFYRFKKRDLAKDKNLFLMIISLMLVGIFSYRYQAKYFPFHLIPFVSFMIIFSGWAFGLLIFMLREVTRSAMGKVSVSIFCLLLIGTCLAQISPWLRNFAVNYCFHDFNRAYAAGFMEKDDPENTSNYFVAAQSLRAVLNPGDQIASFGPYPLIPFLLKKKLPTYYPCVHHLLMMRRDGKIFPIQKVLIRQYSHEMIISRPRFIIMTAELPVQKRRLFNFMSYGAAEALEKEFPELLKFIQTNYRLKIIIGKVYIYEFLGSSVKKNSEKNSNAGK